MNYKIAFDRITTAYIAGELDPWYSCGCFIGNLLNGSKNWGHARTYYDPKQCSTAVECVKNNSDDFYNINEILELEKYFLTTIWAEVGKAGFKMHFNIFSYNIYEEDQGFTSVKNLNNYEDILFIAMEKTLEELKRLHISKGEIIDEAPVFTKRVLEKA